MKQVIQELHIPQTTYGSPLWSGREAYLKWHCVVHYGLTVWSGCFLGFSIRVWPIEEKITTSLGRKPWFPSLCGILIFTNPVFVRLPRYLGWPIPVFMRVFGHSNKWSWMSAIGFKYSVYKGFWSSVIQEWYIFHTFYLLDHRKKSDWQTIGGYICLKRT